MQNITGQTTTATLPRSAFRVSQVRLGWSLALQSAERELPQSGVMGYEGGVSSILALAFSRPGWSSRALRYIPRAVP